MELKVTESNERIILPQRPPVNLEFQDLSYIVPQGKKDSKLILRSISGQFRSGHLSAILGASGSGKSTLLNVLAGYKTTGAEGSITINDSPRNMNEFRKLSRYIMQDNILQPTLTVQEYMMIAANLKFSRELSNKDKLTAIAELLETLRLTSAKDTLTDKLSGGEQKRVSIALELLNNPSVIFLDEPTSGLDEVSSSQCISLLKMLAEGGRTVICSIHAPSDSIFAKFDHVYVVAAGQCTFQGNGKEIIPFTSSVGLSCPKNYNPADFIVEISNGDYGNELLEKISTAIENGKNTNYCRKSTCVLEHSELSTDLSGVQNSGSINASTRAAKKQTSIYQHNSSTWYQSKILLRKFWKQNFQNLRYLILKIVSHFLLGITLGIFYLNVGQDGSKALFNYTFCVNSANILFYVSLMPAVLHFPKEIQLIKREYFNQWYGLGAYYLAMSIADLPMHFFTTACYVSVAYIISDQTLEFQRIAMFYLICVLTVFTSESIGLIIGSLFNIVNGSIVGPCLLAPLSALTVYGVGLRSAIPPFTKAIMKYSYLRLAVEGLMLSLNDNGRPILPCPEEETICIFRDPKYMITYMGMDLSVYWVNVIGLTVYFLMFRLTSFYLLQQLLQPNKFFVFLKGIVRNRGLIFIKVK